MIPADRLPDSITGIVAQECPGYEIDDCHMQRDFATNEVVIRIRLRMLTVAEKLAAAPAADFAKNAGAPATTPCGPWPFEQRTHNGATATLVHGNAPIKVPEPRDGDVLALWNKRGKAGGT